MFCFRCAIDGASWCLAALLPWWTHSTACLPVCHKISLAKACSTASQPSTNSELVIIARIDIPLARYCGGTFFFGPFFQLSRIQFDTIRMLLSVFRSFTHTLSLHAIQEQLIKLSTENVAIVYLSCTSHTEIYLLFYKCFVCDSIAQFFLFLSFFLSLASCVCVCLLICSHINMYLSFVQVT